MSRFFNKIDDGFVVHYLVQDFDELPEQEFRKFCSAALLAERFDDKMEISFFAETDKDFVNLFDELLKENGYELNQEILGQDLSGDSLP